MKMKKRHLMNFLTGSSSLKKISLIFFLYGCMVIFLSPAFSGVPQREILVIKVSGAISPASSEFIGKGIRGATAMNAEALVIELDTPGGLDSSMRNIVKDIISSTIPV